jgi:hypothetical protein
MNNEIIGANHVELTELTSDKVHLTLRLETKGQPPSPNACEQYLQDNIPQMSLVQISYICDICQKHFKTSEMLVNYQCDKCGHYYDVCPDCHPSDDGCYICNNHGPSFEEQVLRMSDQLCQKYTN